MIVYGSKAKEIAKENITDKCPGCETNANINLSLFQRYAHVFWIPSFPIKKIGVAQCSHCKYVWQKQNFSESLLRKYEALKAERRTPLWTFAGLLIFTFVISWAVIDNEENDQRNANFILEPQREDIYEIKNGNNQYSLLKIADVLGDSVFLLFNQFETNKLSGLEDLKAKGDAAFSQDTFTVAKSDLKVMLEEGKIIDIDRK